MGWLAGRNVQLLILGGLVVVAVVGIPNLRAVVIDAGTGLLANQIAFFIVASFVVFTVAAVFINLIIRKITDFNTIDLHNSVWIWR